MYVHTQRKHSIVMHVAKCLTPVNFFQRTKKQKSTRKMQNKQNVRVVSASFMASMRQNATLTLVVISTRKETSSVLFAML